MSRPELCRRNGRPCPRLEMEWDHDRREYAPYCWEYDVWNDTVPFGRPVRNGVCLTHGRPEAVEPDDIDWA